MDIHSRIQLGKVQHHQAVLEGVEHIRSHVIVGHLFINNRCIRFLAERDFLKGTDYKVDYLKDMGFIAPAKEITKEEELEWSARIETKCTNEGLNLTEFNPHP